MQGTDHPADAGRVRARAGILMTVIAAAALASTASAAREPARARLPQGGMTANAREQLARGRALWDLRLARSAIAALEAAARDRETAAEALEALGRIYTFRGWQQEGVFPGWHDEPEVRDKALAALRAAVEADPARASAREALRAAEAFAAADRVDPAPPRPEVAALDERLASFRTAPDAPVDRLLDTLEQRSRLQADPAPFFTAAQILIERGELKRAAAVAERGLAAAERFIDENWGAYGMDGKWKGALARARATAADLAGWAAFLGGDRAAALARLEEAERLSRGQDLANQFHLGELRRADGDADRAREHYLQALSLAAGPAPLRQQARQALAGLPGPWERPDRFDAWLEAELQRRREARRAAALTSLVDRRLPSLALSTPDGRPFDIAALRGKVLLLNFFTSW